MMLSAAHAAVPTIKSIDLVTYTDQTYVSWDVEFGGPAIDMECKLNGDDAKRCQYSGNPGTSGCTIMGADLYDLTPDAGGETMTVPNILDCTACDTATPTDCDNMGKTFYPLSFTVTAPPRITAVVGDKYMIIVTVNNNGTLSDAYTMSVVSSNSKVLLIENGQRSTQTINKNTYQQIYTDALIMSSEETVDATLTVTSNTSRDHVPPYGGITHTQIIPAWGSDKSLPDFGFFGILQIMLAAAVLVSFLS